MKVRTAFVLCAGRGNRLRPLTDQVPKPLVPVCGVALVEFTLARVAALGVERIVINTHHLAEEFVRIFPNYPKQSEYAGIPVLFRHETVLLETGGGLKNVEDLLLPGPVLVHNGDILTTLDLAALCAAHEKSDALSTLALRSTGGPLHVGFDTATGCVTDIRQTLGKNNPEFLYTGVCVVASELLTRIPPHIPISFVPVWLDALRGGEKIGGLILNQGLWRDIGTIAEYLKIHTDLASGAVILKSPLPGGAPWPQWKMRGADIEKSATLHGWNWLGMDCHVGAGVALENTILWAGARVEAHASLSGCVVREGMIATGNLENVAV